MFSKLIVLVWAERSIDTTYFDCRCSAGAVIHVSDLSLWEVIKSLSTLHVSSSSYKNLMKPVEAAAAKSLKKDDNALLTLLWTVAEYITFQTFHQGCSCRVTPPSTMNFWQLGREMARGFGWRGRGSSIIPQSSRWMCSEYFCLPAMLLSVLRERMRGTFGRRSSLIS